VRAGWELNAPPAAAPAGSSAPGRSFLSVEGPCILETLKAADDGRGWILRLYEPHGGRGPVTVTAHRDLASVESCNHVEEAGKPLVAAGASFSFQTLPFQIHTFRVTFA
jgi:alpha-mannosidase